MVFLGLVVLEMIAIIVTSAMHQTFMACLSYFIILIAILYIFYLLLNKPLELAENDTNLWYISQHEMKYCTIYTSFEDVPDEVKTEGYTFFFYRGMVKISTMSICIIMVRLCFIFSGNITVNFHQIEGGKKWIRIFSKSNGLDKTSENITKALLSGTIFAIVAGIAVLFYTNVKYQPEFQEFYTNHSTYDQGIKSNSTQNLYNFHSDSNPEEVRKHFKDCDFTLVLCENPQGGYLFTKCICVNRAKYAVDIVNLNQFVTIGEENFETQLKNLGNDYQDMLTLAEDTFKIHFNDFVVLKYDGFSSLFHENTLSFTPETSFLEAVNLTRTTPELASSMEEAMSQFYLSTGLSTDSTAYCYSDYVTQIANVENAYLNHLRTNGKYPQTMEVLLYQVENDFMLSLLQNIAEHHFPENSDIQCLETNMSWSSVENLLMLATYKHKSLYNSYYSEENTISIPYTSQCMWYENDNAFYVYTSQNDIDSLSIHWLYYTIGR